MIPNRALIGSLRIKSAVSCWIFESGTPAAFALFTTLVETSKIRRMRLPVDWIPKKLMPVPPPNPPPPEPPVPRPFPRPPLPTRLETWSETISLGSSGSIWSMSIFGSSGSANAVGRMLCILSLKLGFGAMPSNEAMFILCSRCLAGSRISRVALNSAGGSVRYRATMTAPATRPATTWIPMLMRTTAMTTRRIRCFCEGGVSWRAVVILRLQLPRQM